MTLRVSTLRDIAAAAEVSVSTASRALRGDHQVSDATRERVEAEARRLRYPKRPRSLASGIMDTGGHTALDRVDVMLQGPHMQHFFAETLLEISRFAGVLGIELAYVVGTEGERWPEFLQRSGGADGMILFTWDSLGEAEGRLIEALSTPAVLVNRHVEGRTNAVTLDDFAAGVRMARYLHGLGHRRIAHLPGDLTSTSVRERAAGLRTGLELLGCYEPGLFLPVDRDNLTESIQQGVDHLLALPEPPTVIWAYNDAAAAVVMTVVRARGLKVPEDVSVAGFDHMTELRDLRLTTFSYRFADLGRSALHLLGGIASGAVEGPIRQCVVPTLIEGATTGPPANSA